MVCSAAVMTASGTVVVLGLGHFVFGAGALGVLLSRQADLTRRIPRYSGGEPCH
tara:strand:+ start:228 stop:389 length:162 start_codon:yes stop_codon:yes gene_type:complete